MMSNENLITCLMDCYTPEQIITEMANSKRMSTPERIDLIKITIRKWEKELLNE